MMTSRPDRALAYIAHCWILNLAKIHGTTIAAIRARSRSKATIATRAEFRADMSKCGFPDERITAMERSAVRMGYRGLR